MVGDVDVRALPAEPLPKESKKHKSKVGNGSIKQQQPEETSSQEASSNEIKYKQKTVKHDAPKKSMSSSCVVDTKPSQMIQESPSMNVLTSKLEDVSLASPSNPDTSLLSEISSGETTTGMFKVQSQSVVLSLMLPFNQVQQLQSQ